MILIENINIGRFGNKLLYYNNLRQIASHFNMPFYSPRFANDDIFLFSDQKLVGTNKPSSNLSVKYLIENKTTTLNGDYLLEPCMGDLFFEYDSLDTTEIFKFKTELEKTEDTVVSIHFRGSDFSLWDPKAILPADYYINAINHLIENYGNLTFKLFTDDKSLVSYTLVLNFLVNNNLKVKEGNINDLSSDFIEMSNSDIIISSPSTFSIAAGFCGKPNKKIIHSKSWVDYQCGKGDKFWLGFNNGGNKNYKKYKLI